MKKSLLILVLVGATFHAQSQEKPSLSKGSKVVQENSEKNSVIPEESSPVISQTQEEKNNAALAKTPQGKNNLMLGLPVSASKEEYAIAKQNLYYENPEKYNELFNQKESENNTGIKVRKVHRSSYNDMPAEKKAYIDAHPELYIIVD